jgi:hypothetical protein
MTATTESRAGYSLPPSLRWFGDTSVTLLRPCLSWVIKSSRRASEVAEVVLFLTVVSLAVAGGLIVVNVLVGIRRYGRRRPDKIPLVADTHAHYQ